MNIKGKPYRTIWIHPENNEIIQIIDQRKLPFELIIEDLLNVNDVEKAIVDMHVRGAGLIGATAGFDGQQCGALHLRRIEPFAVDAGRTEQQFGEGKVEQLRYFCAGPIVADGGKGHWAGSVDSWVRRDA